jgi:ribosomal protein S18 acetylase RimI-like enzyme
VRARWGRVFQHLDRIHPLEPHWYLATLGVAPGSQSRGVGRALLRALTTRADRDPLPCYLETDRPENVAFYERAGFRIERESRILGVRVWHMQRPAAGA